MGGCEMCGDVWRYEMVIGVSVEGVRCVEVPCEGCLGLPSMNLFYQ